MFCPSSQSKRAYRALSGKFEHLSARFRSLKSGFPIVIADQMPDCLPGACPVAFGNFKEGYTVVTRSGLTMRPDPYTASFCTLFRFEPRVGGTTTCPKAIRFLRIR